MKEQVAAFAEEYQALLHKYASEPGEHPPDARQMAVRLMVLPDDGRGAAPLVDDM
ncbi:hypothetical protein [Streptomyces sp. BE133]|uniref:hypothetical protein n=1 Tax=Streptomyces sp. BE133 TaxID=3002523 RepID=UPI002E796B91|nr:hypothetical protein [Streptomyces sp. BE133]MEE1808455.1 hypothetical protein [Streptomyces sp. BE133]